MSFIASLKKARDEMRASQADPWHLRLEGVRVRSGTTVSSGLAPKPCSTSWRCRTAHVPLAHADVWLSSCVSWVGVPLRPAASHLEAFVIRSAVMLATQLV
jgi:hypothetical protein